MKDTVPTLSYLLLLSLFIYVAMKIFFLLHACWLRPLLAAAMLSTLYLLFFKEEVGTQRWNEGTQKAKKMMVPAPAAKVVLSRYCTVNTSPKYIIIIILL